ncbi:MAG: undecaprenyldiphospho-muramoylpentapeptide beta-N-acetylglucosaminyltransferase [Candidatus Portnoybacteria bacterium CG10_big_fil_rev_8_21_14_0_10_38_18]|uniref:UDP-N-acetylglucosamine--N-acetylmuramyl-(pentapeptide) pyrophosphoryl-undecaprenol N-acetylglucosamine transferase n=1 Tax=Candidatus Portnoybacteria bacterium CG10_big_fil_rev_8_21_14_0_10_38_18 TaxID=1974813 RepID=A0A2M8KCL6_9BACT|nr:MAG: undecaprenyldiphospho-muramoylpentapeptide beta-N-acetylglucosaminyltransferase [Candidatus Portnoybacteria bacterium CG10_big_fil_rev_8_21_14_0_10_38_18]
MRILFTGGGTGGHIFPIIAIKESFPHGYDFYYVGPDDFARENLANPPAGEAGRGIMTKFISAGKLRRYFSLQGPIDMLKILLGIIQSFWHLFFIMPDVIFSKGGYGSFPVLFVGWIYRIPIVLHESDSAPGLATRTLAKFAKKIILSFEGSRVYFPKYQEKLVLIGNPIREELIQGDRNQGRELFKISSQKPVILILGGSQGAQKINETVLSILTRILELAEVIHISGERNAKIMAQESKKILKYYKGLKYYYHLYSFLSVDQLKHAYAVADLIVNRAGAGSIYEIAALGKPSILIPIPNSAQDHQRKNAHDFAKIGGAVVLEQENLTPNIFLEQISNLLKNPDKLKEMGEKAKTFYKPNIAEKIRDEIINAIKSKD